MDKIPNEIFEYCIKPYLIPNKETIKRRRKEWLYNNFKKIIEPDIHNKKGEFKNRVNLFDDRGFILVMEYDSRNKIYDEFRFYTYANRTVKDLTPQFDGEIRIIQHNKESYKCLIRYLKIIKFIMREINQNELKWFVKGYLRGFIENIWRYLNDKDYLEKKIRFLLRKE